MNAQRKRFAYYATKLLKDNNNKLPERNLCSDTRHRFMFQKRQNPKRKKLCTNKEAVEVQDLEAGAAFLRRHLQAGKRGRQFTGTMTHLQSTRTRPSPSLPSSTSEASVVAKPIATGTNSRLQVTPECVSPKGLGCESEHTQA